MEPRKVIIAASNPKKLNVCAGLPADGAPIEQMTPEQFVERARHYGNSIKTWSESISTMEEDFKIEDFKSENPQPKLPMTKKAFDTLQKKSSDGLDNLALGFMGPELGYGVFALKSFEENYPIGIYTGNVCSISLESHNARSAYNDSLEMKKGDDYSLAVDSQHEGNITRFIQHSFTKNSPSLNLYKLKTDTFCSANTIARTYFYHNQPLHILFTTKAIKKNEMLTIDYDGGIRDFRYSYSHWHAIQSDPFLFDHYGHILKAPKDYEVVNVSFTILLNSKLLNARLSAVLPVQVIENSICTKTNFSLESKLDAKAAVTPKILEEIRQKNPHAAFITCYSAFFVATPERYKKDVAKLFKKITGLDWFYDYNKKTVFTKEKAPIDDSLLNYLKSMGLPISKCRVSASAPKLAGEWILVVNCKSYDLEKAAEIPPFSAKESKAHEKLDAQLNRSLSIR